MNIGYIAQLIQAAEIFTLCIDIKIDYSHHSSQLENDFR